MRLGKLHHALLTACLISLGSQAADRPNVLLIVADDMALSDIGAFGSEIATPNLDALAKEGVRLSNFHTSPNCSPTRAMLLTGTDSHISGMGNMGEFMQPEQRGKPGYENRLNERAASLAEVMREAGYNTFMTGKWHLGRSEEHSPKTKGFEKSFALIQGGASHFDDMKGFWAQDPTALYRENGKQTKVPEGFFSTEFYTERMIDYIESGRESGKPFFSYLAYTAPHWPLQAPDEWLEKFAGRYAEGYEAVRGKRLENMKKLGLLPQEVEPNLPMAKGLPSWEQLSDEQRQREARTMEVFAAMVGNMDHHIGQLLDYLKRIGQYDNTLIIFMSDNGAAGNSPANLGQNRQWIAENFDNSLGNMGRKGSFIDLGAQWAQATAVPSPLYKGFTTQGGINTPAIVSFPGQPNKGQIVKELTHVMDVMPTILDVAGIDQPGQRFLGRDVHPIQGLSIVPAIRGEAVAERVIGWELFDRRALRKGDWKLVFNEKPYAKGDWALYNLANDPSESRDLATAEPAKLKELLAEWERYVKENGVILATLKEKPGGRTCLYEFCFE
jgi:arylsulfatase A-like enzyme